MKPEILLFHPPSVLRRSALRSASISPLLCGYGLLHIGTHLKNLGYGVECWNIPLAYKMGLDNDHLEGIFRKYDPMLVGIELNWLHLSKGTLDLAKFLKEIHPDVPIVVGGVHATLFAGQVIKASESVDVVVQGEGERIVEDVARRIDKRQECLDVPGTVARDHGKIVRNDGRNIHENIDAIPPYTPSILKPAILNPYGLAMINTCRGPCNHDCVHCVGARSKYCLSPRTRITFHSVSWIIKQIQILLDRVKRVSIQDYIYSNSKFLVELCRAIRKERFQEDIEFFNLALVPSPDINREVLSALSKAGIDNIDLGIESGSNNILKLLGRPYSTQHAANVIKNSIKEGILPKTYWMITGFETPSDLAENQKFLKETIGLGGIPKWVTPLCVIPGTRLFDNAKDHGLTLKLKSFEDFMQFSTERFDRNGYYPNLITHETPLMDRFHVLMAAWDLKKLVKKHRSSILEKLEANMEIFSAAHPQLFETQYGRRVKGVLDNIGTTFF